MKAITTEEIMDSVLDGGRLPRGRMSDVERFVAASLREYMEGRGIDGQDRRLNARSCEALDAMLDFLHRHENGQQLKPCPFCGETEVYLAEITDSACVVKCGRCSCSTRPFPRWDASAAVRAWNRRGGFSEMD